jgi:hypothetical protein
MSLLMRGELRWAKHRAGVTDIPSNIKPMNNERLNLITNHLSACSAPTLFRPTWLVQLQSESQRAMH